MMASFVVGGGSFPFYAKGASARPLGPPAAFLTFASLVIEVEECGIKAWDRVGRYAGMPIPCPEEGCDKVFSSRQALQYHLDHAVCKKPELICKCGKEFNRRYRYNEHVAKCQHSDNYLGGNPEGDADVPGAERVEVLDFDKTSEQAVIDFVSANADARQRLSDAFECGCLHEEITRLTHFKGPPENRNVFNFDGKSVNMKVIYEGEPLQFDAARGVMMIIDRNIRIAQDPIVREVLGVTDGDVLATAMTARQLKYETQQIRTVLENSGRYVMIQRPPPLERTTSQRRFWSTRTRNCVAAQQGWQCNICDRLLTSAYDIDHNVPLFKGGADEYFNLQALCVECHRNKTAAERSGNRVLLPN